MQKIPIRHNLPMHIFDYSFLKDSLLPAQLVTLAANIAALKAMSAT